MAMPPLTASADFTVQKPELSPADLDRLVASARRDAADDSTRAFLDERVPRADRDHAAILVWSDVAARDPLHPADLAGALVTAGSRSKRAWIPSRLRAPSTRPGGATSSRGSSERAMRRVPEPPVIAQHVRSGRDLVNPEPAHVSSAF
jgi:hypothetical protein